MEQQLVQLRSKKEQSPQPEPASLPFKVPSSFWIYRMKVKVILVTFFYALRSRHPWASLHRYILAVTTPDSKRARLREGLQGECNRCGHCCRIHFDCPFFYQEPGGISHCTIYMTKHAPKVCVIFPLDPSDLAEIKRAIAPNECSFSFAPRPDERPSDNSFGSHLRKLLQFKRG